MLEHLEFAFSAEFAPVHDVDLELCSDVCRAMRATDVNVWAMREGGNSVFNSLLREEHVKRGVSDDAC